MPYDYSIVHNPDTGQSELVETITDHLGRQWPAAWSAERSGMRPLLWLADDDPALDGASVRYDPMSPPCSNGFLHCPDSEGLWHSADAMLMPLCESKPKRDAVHWSLLGRSAPVGSDGVVDPSAAWELPEPIGEAGRDPHTGLISCTKPDRDGTPGPWPPDRLVELYLRPHRCRPWPVTPFDVTDPGVDPRDHLLSIAPTIGPLITTIFRSPASLTRFLDVLAYAKWSPVFRYMVVMVGPKRAGKSTAAKLLALIIGDNDIDEVTGPLSRVYRPALSIGDRFSMAGVTMDVRVLWCNESLPTTVTAANALKGMIRTASRIPVEKKGIDPLTIRAPMVMSDSNTLDKSFVEHPGIDDRLCFLHATLHEGSPARLYPHLDADALIMANLHEVGAISRWIDGWWTPRIRDHGDWQPVPQPAMDRKWRELALREDDDGSDPVVAFCNRHLVYEEGVTFMHGLSEVEIPKARDLRDHMAMIHKGMDGPVPQVVTVNHSTSRKLVAIRHVRYRGEDEGYLNMDPSAKSFMNLDQWIPLRIMYSKGDFLSHDDIDARLQSDGLWAGSDGLFAEADAPPNRWSTIRKAFERKADRGHLVRLSRRGPKGDQKSFESNITWADESDPRTGPGGYANDEELF